MYVLIYVCVHIFIHYIYSAHLVKKAVGLERSTQRESAREERNSAVIPRESYHRCMVLQCVAVCCSVLQCVAVCCSVLQCAAVCCSVLQCEAVVEVCESRVCVRCSVLLCVAMCCSVL